MTDEAIDPHGEWPRGWEEHRIRQLRRMAAWPFAKKLEWLESAQELANALSSGKVIEKQEGAVDQGG